MKRTIQFFLTFALSFIVLANLVLIILYGRQFIFRADSVECLGKSCETTLALTDFFVMNLILVGLFLVVWLAVYLTAGRHVRN